MRSPLVIAFLTFLAISQIHSYNIFFIMPFDSRSHKTVLDAVAEGLVKKGHQITYMSGIKEENEQKGIKNLFINYTEIRSKLEGKDKDFSFFNGSMGKPANIQIMMDLMGTVRNAVYNTSDLQDILKHPEKYKFDAVILDAIFNEYLLPIGHHLGVPTIYVSPSILFTPISWNMNIPYPYSYLNSGLHESQPNMNFYQRGLNTFVCMIFLALRRWYIFPKHEEFIRTVLPHSPPLLELERNVSFAMTHTHPAIYTSMPSMPYKIEFACAHCKPNKPLPKELANFFNHSGEPGVIFFSLGSATKGEEMPLEMRAKVIEAFSKLPQRILWKYENDIPGLPENIKLTKWAPQQDLLAHPNMRLFITHGGGLSILESVYHGCPVLGFPLSADQLANMGYAKAKGFGISMDWRTFTADELFKTINHMITDKRLKKSALLASSLLKDQPQHPVDKAAYWIEYVIRHKGAPHLKSAAEHLNFFQYFLLDVIGSFLIALFIFISILYYLIKICYRFIRKPKKEPTRKQKTH